MVTLNPTVPLIISKIVGSCRLRLIYITHTLQLNPAMWPNEVVQKLKMVLSYASVRSMMNDEFSQTSLNGQGLLLLEQGIARVCSIGEQVL